MDILRSNLDTLPCHCPVAQLAQSSDSKSHGFTMVSAQAVSTNMCLLHDDQHASVDQPNNVMEAIMMFCPVAGIYNKWDGCRS